MEYLKKNDKIAIVSTARKISESEILPAINKLEEWGFEVVTGKNIYKTDNQFAGTDFERAEDFQLMLDDDSVKAILCARGGYGTVRIIEKLNFKKFIKNPKWIIGYSDITVLHSYLHTKLNIPSIHATMPLNFLSDGSDNESTNSLKNALFGNISEYQVTDNEFNKPGFAEGILIGGNLSILYSLSGTELDIDTKNKILFIEDIDEYLYHIDRMMMNLNLSGKLKNLSGLIVGGMTDMRDNTIPFGKSAYQIISDIVSEYNYPVCFNFNAGHAEPNLALCFGKPVQLSVMGNKSELKFL